MVVVSQVTALQEVQLVTFHEDQGLPLPLLQRQVEHFFRPKGHPHLLQGRVSTGWCFEMSPHAA